MSRSEPVTLAAVTGAHGVTGEVRLKLFGEGIAALSAYSSFNDGTLTLTKVREGAKGGAVARFAEVSDRNAAEKLRGTVLTVPREMLPELGEDEYYHSDLIGLPVVTETGEVVGIVHAVENFGASDILEIEKPDGKKFMIPLSEEAVPRWDSEQITISGEFVD